MRSMQVLVLLIAAAGWALSAPARAAEPPASAAPASAAPASAAPAKGAQPVAAVRGEIIGSGLAFGLHGITASPDAGSCGVVGEATATTGATTGVFGQVLSPAGTAGVFDNLAGGTVLRGLAGGAEVFRVEASGAVVAASFAGDGAALTDLDPAHLAAGTAAIDVAGNAATASGAEVTSDLGCTACVALPELAFAAATLDDLGTVQTALADHLADTGNPHAVTLEPLVPAMDRGDLLVDDGTSVVRLPAGSDGQVLVADAAAPAGLRWADAGGRDPINPKQVALLRWFEARQGITVPAGDAPFGLAFDGEHVWVANNSAATLSKVRASDGTMVGTFPIAFRSQEVVFDGIHAWITSPIDGLVARLRASDGHVGFLLLSGGPQGLVFDGAHVWVARTLDDTVSKVRASDGAVLGTFPVGDSPTGLAFDGVHVWVTLLGDDTVSRLRTSDGAVLDTFPVGLRPRGVIFDGAHIWVANSSDDSVSKLRASDGTTLGTFPVGFIPWAIAFDGVHVWVSNQGDGTVSKLRADDGSVIETFAVGSSPRGVAFDGANVWVANDGDDTLSKL